MSIAKGAERPQVRSTRARDDQADPFKLDHLLLGLVFVVLAGRRVSARLSNRYDHVLMFGARTDHVESGEAGDYEETHRGRADLVSVTNAARTFAHSTLLAHWTKATP